MTWLRTCRRRPAVWKWRCCRVVPVSAGVGSDRLPGDFGFDPLDLASRDLFRPTQQFLNGDNNRLELNKVPML